MHDPIMDAALTRPPGKEGWSYRDLPQMRADFFQQFLDVIGEENLCWITRAQYQHSDGLYMRGQVFVSPEGLERARAHNAAQPK